MQLNEASSMTLNSYQDFTDTTAVYPVDAYIYLPVIGLDGEEVPHELEGHQIPWLYPALALGEEAGEVLGKIAKFVRKKGRDTDQLRELVKKELGDVLYQVSQLARQFDITLEELAQDNKAHLEDRKDRGVIIGEGDER